MIKAGIIGGAGYTAGELIRLLINHPDVEIEFVNSSSNAGNKITDVHSGLLPPSFYWIKSMCYFSVQHTETQKNSWKLIPFPKN